MDWAADEILSEFENISCKDQCKCPGLSEPFWYLWSRDGAGISVNEIIPIRSQLGMAGI